MDVDKRIRELAKSDSYQTLFSLGKELKGIQLFDNISDFTGMQISFMRYLNFYSSLYLEIALGEVDKIVLENDIYSDSYMMYKHQADKKNASKSVGVPEQENPNKTRWVFKDPSKKK